MAFGRTGCVNKALKLKTCDNVFIFTSAVFRIHFLPVNEFITRCNNDRAILLCRILHFVLIIDRSDRTYFFADTAFVLCQFQASLCINDRFGWNCLCKRDIDRRTFAHSLVEFAGHLCRTFGLAKTAAGAKVMVNIFCFFLNCYFKVSDISVHFLHFAGGLQCDIRMCSGINHLWCGDTCGAVHRREGLIEHDHMSADRRLFLNDRYIVACISNIQSSLDSGNTTTDNKCSFRDRNSGCRKRFVIRNLSDCHLNEVDCFFCCFFLIRMYPCALLTQVCDLEQIRVDLCALQHLAECCLMHSRRAGSNDNTIKIMLFDCFFDHSLARL